MLVINMFKNFQENMNILDEEMDFWRDGNSRTNGNPRTEKIQ